MKLDGAANVSARKKKWKKYKKKKNYKIINFELLPLRKKNKNTQREIKQLLYINEKLLKKILETI